MVNNKPEGLVDFGFTDFFPDALRIVLATRLPLWRFHVQHLEMFVCSGRQTHAISERTLCSLYSVHVRLLAGLDHWYRNMERAIATMVVEAAVDA